MHSMPYADYGALMRIFLGNSISRTVILTSILLFALTGGVFAATESAPSSPIEPKMKWKTHLKIDWPLPPTHLKMESAGANAVTISWEASNSSHVVNYLIFRNGVHIASVSGTTLSFTDTGAAPGKTYTYSIKSK